MTLCSVLAAQGLIVFTYFTGEEERRVTSW